MDLPSRADPNYMKLLSAQKDAAVAVVNMGLKANDTALRKRENDVLAKLLASINGEPALEARVIN